MPEFILKITPNYIQNGNTVLTGTPKFKIAVRIKDRIIDLPYGVNAKA